MFFLTLCAIIKKNKVKETRRKKMKKRIVAVLCIGMISATMVMAGCSSNEQEKETTKKTETVKTTDTEEKTETVKGEENKNNKSSENAASDNKSTEESETSKAEEVSDKTAEESREVVTQNQASDIVGEWTVDWDMTNANNTNPVSTEFGSGISLGDNITFNADGTFSWYLGIGNGGKGTYAEDNGQISVSYTKDIDNSQKDMNMTISDGEIVMNIWGDDSYFVYWKRK